MSYNISKVMIVGLGLIGGSLAKALRRSVKNISITGCDSSSASVHKACFEGAINVGYCCGSPQDYADPSSGIINEIRGADIIFLCTNIEICREVSKVIVPHVSEHTIISDVCSTKAELAELFGSFDRPVSYIGGHPMTGSEKSGYDASSGYLFENAIYIMCPGKNVTEEQQDKFRELVKNTGALPFLLDPREHDTAMARISHLPHVVASALVNTALLKETPEGTLALLAAGGFKDVTRIASGDPVLWRNIIFANSGNICEAIDDHINILRELQEKIKSGDCRAIEEFLTRARNYRDSLNNGSRTLMNLMYELSVDVEDKPGAIAAITSKLYSEGINIKNIYVAESREREGGCLRLVFDSKETRNRAESIIGSMP